MTIAIPRRRALQLCLASAGLAALPALARAQDPTGVEDEVDHLLGDLPIGSPDAPVTIYEYLSLTCPHCANFHVNSWPIIRRDYVDTGKVLFIMREVYFDRPGLWATMAARCADEAAYHAMIDQFLTRQEEWTQADDVPEAIRRVARLNGVPEQRLNDCLSDRDFAETLVETYQRQADEDGIRATPTFIVNGEKAEGAISVETLAAMIDQYL